MKIGNDDQLEMAVFSMVQAEKRRNSYLQVSNIMKAHCIMLLFISCVGPVLKAKAIQLHSKLCEARDESKEFAVS